jgi:transcriptional regulator with XRE-family HTH domain
MQVTENEQVKKVVATLREKGIVKNDSDIAESLDYSRSTISEILNGTSGVSRKFLDKFCAEYGVSRAYITSGTGDKFESEQIEQLSHVAESRVRYISGGEHLFMYAPLINQYAYAGYLNGYSDEEYLTELPRAPFNVDREHKGNYVCFEVRGDSMNDGTIESYIEGDLALCREINTMHWQSKLHINRWDFVIVHRTEGILLKRIVDHDIELGVIKVHSLNPFYEDFEIALNDVVQLFNVVKIERRK